jgi:hypothetical protein
MARFVQPFEYRAGEWRVAVRWKREDPFKLLEPKAALQCADDAEREGDEEFAEALRAAAVEAERESARDNR